MQESKTVKAYLDAIEGRKGEKPQQVKDGIEVYVELWRRVIQNGLVDPSEPLESALEKVEKAGGLYKAAEI